MVSFAVRRTLTTTARLLILTVVALPCPGFAQRAALEPGPGAAPRNIAGGVPAEGLQHDTRAEDVIDQLALLEPGAGAGLEQIAAQLRAEQQQNGLHSAALIGPLRALGLLHEENGDHGLATATIDRARQVLRVNYGLHALDEAPLIQQQIRNERARGDFAEAWRLEQQLLALLERHPGDLRTVRLHHEIGDRRMRLLRRYVAGEFPPEIVLGCYYNPKRENFRSCHAGSRSVVIRAILAEAERSYRAAIRALTQHERYSSDELRELEMKVVRNNYTHRGNYRAGKQSLRRLVAYDTRDSAPLSAQIDSLVQLADWDILFSNFGTALDRYQAAYEQIADGADEASIEEIFAPRIPIALPAFLPNPLASEETPATTGHIDVAFEITKFGKSRNIEILETTANAPTAAGDALVDTIKRRRFRPIATDGAVADSPRLVVRYYLND